MAKRTTRATKAKPVRTSVKRIRNIKRVLIIGSEAVPFAKTGGLADVLGALPSALSRLGWQVTLALPRYRGVVVGDLVERSAVTVGGVTHAVAFYDAELGEGARALLVDCPDLFDREGMYGVDGVDYDDSPRRFAVLVRAALEFVARKGSGPSVVHAHDWQAGLAPVYLKTLYQSHPTLGGIPSVFTIHNLAYQGLCDARWVPDLDLPWETFTMDRMEFWGRISLLKGGITDATVITTVSRQYAKEVQTPEFGFGLDGILRHRSADLVGILNGIDTDEWDPSHDKYLPEPYDAADLSGKGAAKRALLDRYGLPIDEATLARPIVGMISRMVDQKGFDLLTAAAQPLMALDATWTILGTGEARYQDFWTALAARFPERVGVHIGFDESRAHVIEGGADLFLMPSHFEPCGLNQMYSLRYGTVPVVHGVGGLVDTVRDYSAPDARSTGFVFREYTDRALVAALERALETFGRNPRRWRGLQTAGMRQDNSWDRSAREDVKIYERAVATERARVRDQGSGTRDQSGSVDGR